MIYIGTAFFEIFERYMLAFQYDEEDVNEGIPKVKFVGSTLYLPLKDAAQQLLD